MDIYKAPPHDVKRSNNKKFGLISFVIFLFCAAVFSLSIYFDQNIKQIFSNIGYSTYGKFMSFLVFIGSVSLLCSTTLVKNKILKIFLWLIFAPIGLFYLIYAFVVRPHKVIGASMSPAIINHEFVLGAPLEYFLSTPKRGDIVIFIAPDTGGESIDRIVGLPGEKISIKDSKVYING